MCSQKIFYSAKLKTERANQHISDVERHLANYSESHPHVMRTSHDVVAGKTIVWVNFPDKPPSDIALAIGDAIHNLRAALDHMTWEMVGRDGGTQDRDLQLPSGRDRVGFEAACQKIKTPSQRVKDALKGLEVFPSGRGDSLYALHRLDIAEKHRVLTPIINAVWISGLVIRDPDGRIILDLANLPLGGNGIVPINCPLGSTVQEDDKRKAAADLVFGDVEFVKMQPVIPLLQRLAHATRDCIKDVEAAIM